MISSGKGVNLPGTHLPIPSLTAKDLDDLAFALENGVDYVALSFVRRADDVADLCERVAAAGSTARVIAKIEKAEAIDDLEAIVQVSDAVMVARGDLGVEIGAPDVPLLQKLIIRSARDSGCTVITATQMLESMVHQPEPTRAEASDVANAVLDGTSAVMLSGETAAGRYPLEAVAMMNRIVRAVEPSLIVSPGRSRGRRARWGRSCRTPPAISPRISRPRRSRCQPSRARPLGRSRGTGHGARCWPHRPTRCAAAAGAGLGGGAAGDRAVGDARRICGSGRWTPRLPAAWWARASRSCSPAAPI